MRQRGVGYAWVPRKEGLTRGDWKNALKLSMNSMVNRGRNEGNRHCRYNVCDKNKIIETLSHIRET